jgi:hypothetical protein
MYTVFSHPASYGYKTTLCSKVTVFYAVTTILTFIAPLLIAYRSQGTFLPAFVRTYNAPKGAVAPRGADALPRR